MNDGATDAVRRFVLAHKSWSDLLFANLRNTMACAALGVAGLLVMNAKCIDVFGQPGTSMIGLAMVVLSAGLLFWNLIFGCFEVISQTLKPSRWAVFFSTIAMTCYVGLGSTFFLGLVKATPPAAFKNVCTKPGVSP